MRRVTFTVRGVGPVLFGRQVMEKKLPDETSEQFEERTYLQKCTVDEDGDLAISGTAIHRSLLFAGAWLSEKFPGGNGKKTYTKRLECGVQPDLPYFKVTRNGTTLVPSGLDVLKLPVPVDGKRGGKSRVIRFFPKIRPGYSFQCSLLLIDDAITEDAFERHAKTAGLYDGLGAMRHGHGGPNGRYICENFKYERVTI